MAKKNKIVKIVRQVVALARSLVYSETENSWGKELMSGIQTKIEQLWTELSYFDVFEISLNLIWFVSICVDVPDRISLAGSEKQREKENDKFGIDLNCKTLEENTPAHSGCLRFQNIRLTKCIKASIFATESQI